MKGPQLGPCGEDITWPEKVAPRGRRAPSTCKTKAPSSNLTHMPPAVGGSSGGCPAVWSISQHRGYCFHQSTVRSPHPCGSSCGPPLLGRRPPPWAVCRQACHRLLPWPPMTFAMVADAARPGSGQWPWSTAPATGAAGRLGRPSASHPGGVVCCTLSLCRPRCVCVCGVLGQLAPILLMPGYKG